MDDIRNKLNKIDHTLEEHTKILSSVDKTLALQNQQLEHHIKRTELAEESIQILRDEFKPVQKHVEFINGCIKLLAGAGSLIAMIYYGTQVIKLWFHI